MYIIQQMKQCRIALLLLLTIPCVASLHVSQYSDLAPKVTANTTATQKISQWSWQPPFDGPLPEKGYSRICYWTNVFMAIVPFLAILAWAWNAEPEVPTQVPSWVPQRMFESNWTDRQRYVLFITSVNWFILGCLIQSTDWNPNWGVYVTREFHLDAGELGMVLSSGGLCGLLGIPLVVLGLNKFGVGWWGFVYFPFQNIMACMYAGLSTPVPMTIAHGLTTLFITNEYIASINRMSRLMPREDIPKCMGLVLAWSMAGEFFGTFIGSYAISLDINLAWIIASVLGYIQLYLNFVNFRKEEYKAVDMDAWASRGKQLGLNSSSVNWIMLCIICFMYFFKTSAMAYMIPSWMPYLDKVAGPLSATTTMLIKNIDRFVQIVMHIAAGEYLKGCSQQKLLSTLVLGYLCMSLSFILYEPSGNLFALAPGLRADATGAVYPVTVWICGVIFGQLLAGFGNTVFGVTILPLIQSFFAADSELQIEMFAPAAYIGMDMLGIFAGTSVGGALVASMSFGKANETMALAISGIAVVAVAMFYTTTKPQKTA